MGWQAASPVAVDHTGSFMIGRAYGVAPVAQWIEHEPSKLGVAGSSPAGRAIPLGALAAPRRAAGRTGGGGHH